MTIKSINTILTYIVFGSFALCAAYSIWGGFVAYVEYTQGKLRTGISQSIFSLSVFIAELMGVVVALFFKDNSVKILPTNAILIINIIASAIFFAFLYTNWRSLWSNGKDYLLHIIGSKKLYLLMFQYWRFLFQ